MTIENDDFKYKGRPGDLEAELFVEEGFDPRDAIKLGEKLRLHNERLARQREGWSHHIDGDREVSGDDEDVECGIFKFTSIMIAEAINRSTEYFKSDAQLTGQSESTLHNAAVVSVGVGMIIAPHIKPPATTAEEALSLGRERGQHAIDLLLCDHKSDLLHDLQKNRITRTDEEELLLHAGGDGKISEADKIKLEDFLKRYHFAIAIAEPVNSAHPGDAQTVRLFSSFDTAEKYVEEAEHYASRLFLKLIGPDKMPTPQSKAKRAISEEHAVVPSLNPPAA